MTMVRRWVPACAGTRLRGNDVYGDGHDGGAPLGSRLRGNDVYGDGDDDGAPLGSRLRGNDVYGDGHDELNKVLVDPCVGCYDATRSDGVLPRPVEDHAYNSRQRS